MTPATTKPLTIVALGDSITACSAVEAEQWTKMVERNLAERFERLKSVVINAVVGGNTSRDGCRMDRDVMVHSPDFVLVEFGGNDATDDASRFVPVAEYSANLAAMKAKLDASGRGEMILLTFPPIIDRNHSWYGREKYREAGGPDRFIEAYRKATRDFAIRHGLALVDVDLAIRAQPSMNISSDGVHLTPAVNREVANTVFPVLVRCIGDKLAAVGKP